MKILLDTHTWLWLQSEPRRLNDKALTLLSDPEETLLFSAASSWEIAIKFSLKKLKLPQTPASYIPSRLTQGGMTPLPVEHGHALRVAQLPLHHRDPFDRLLIAQAQLEDATIATADPQFLLYDVDVLWAASGAPPSAVHDRPRRRWGRRKTAARSQKTKRSRAPRGRSRT